MTKPNILILMVDQLNGTLFPDGPADWLHAPNLKRLAQRSTRFANTYKDFLPVFDGFLNLDSIGDDGRSLTFNINPQTETRPFRKMGHVTILDDDLDRLLETAAWVRENVKVMT